HPRPRGARRAAREAPEGVLRRAGAVGPAARGAPRGTERRQPRGRAASPQPECRVGADERRANGYGRLERSRGLHRRHHRASTRGRSLARDRGAPLGRGARERRGARDQQLAERAEGQPPVAHAARRRRSRRRPPRPGAGRREGDRGDRRPDEPDHAVGADGAVRDPARDAGPEKVGFGAPRARVAGQIGERKVLHLRDEARPSRAYAILPPPRRTRRSPQAEAVRWSFVRTLRLNAGPAWMLSDFLKEDAIKVLDDYTIQFTLTQPYAPFLSFVPWWYVMNPKQVLTQEQSGDLGQKWLTDHE